MCAPILAAADEIVWSCYEEIFRNAKRKDTTVAQPTIPLPYIEPRYSPHATPRVDPPADLQSEFFTDLLKQLPIPVVSIPPICINNPWWLIFLGHEVGHHVQYDLLPDSGFVLRFRELLKKAVEPPPPADPEAAERWARWDLEVFADVFSVLNMGGWAAWAMSELAVSDAMLQPVKRYPAAVVRLALLARLSQDLGVLHVDPLRGLDPQELVEDAPDANGDTPLKRQARADLALVPKVSSGLLDGHLNGLGTLKELCGWRPAVFELDGEIDFWARAFRGKAALAPDPTIRGAKLAISGAAAAWSEIATLDASERAEERTKLTERILAVVPDCAEPGTRAASAATTSALEDISDRWADALLAISDEELAR